MVLNFEQIRAVTRGSVYTEEKDGWVRFHRFTEGQERIYAALHPEFIGKTTASAGVRLAFYTDSKSLSFQFRLALSSSRTYARMDVCCNGALVSHIGVNDYEGQIYRAEVALEEGRKAIEIYLPWTMCCEIRAFTLDDGAAVEPLVRAHTMICYGDSITQGYDAKYPSLAYVSAMGRLLDADPINKGIGGEIFFPELLEAPDAISPDYITVAYGTNDWSGQERDFFISNCRAFYAHLSALYPKAKIFALAPIWRSNGTAETKYGEPVTAVYRMICEQTADLENVTVICGDALIPHLKPFTTDGLHPNDAGFGLYAQNLYLAIKPYL